METLINILTSPTAIVVCFAFVYFMLEYAVGKTSSAKNS